MSVHDDRISAASERMQTHFGESAVVSYVSLEGATTPNIDAVLFRPRQQAEQFDTGIGTIVVRRVDIRRVSLAAVEHNASVVIGGVAWAIHEIESTPTWWQLQVVDYTQSAFQGVSVRGV